MHVPAAAVDRAIGVLSAERADGCVAIGGGSTVGLAKALALRAGAPYLAIPTTYSGSEMTPVWGTTTDGVKRTGRDDRVRAHTVLYDPTLTFDLPVDVSVTSGFNAVAHAVEALYAPDANPLTDALAATGISTMLDALPRLLHDARDVDARAGALTAAWMCGSCLGATTMGLHHKICHVLGGAFNLPHAQTHTVVLPYVLGYNLPAADHARRTLTQILPGGRPAHAMWALGRKLGVPHSLRSLGLRPEDIRTAVEMIGAAAPQRPRSIGPDALTSLLTAALDGVDPDELDENDFDDNAEYGLTADVR
jgi:maleylacetate reductase